MFKFNVCLKGEQYIPLDIGFRELQMYMASNVYTCVVLQTISI